MRSVKLKFLEKLASQFSHETVTTILYLCFIIIATKILGVW